MYEVRHLYPCVVHICVFRAAGSEISSFVGVDRPLDTMLRGCTLHNTGMPPELYGEAPSGVCSLFMHTHTLVFYKLASTNLMLLIVV